MEVLLYISQSYYGIACNHRLDLTMEERQNLTADICVFVGETLNVDCTTNDDEATLALEENGVVVVNNSFSFVVQEDRLEIMYGCGISSAEGRCGTFRQMSNVQVFGM